MPHLLQRAFPRLEKEKRQLSGWDNQRWCYVVSSDDALTIRSTSSCGAQIIVNRGKYVKGVSGFFRFFGGRAMMAEFVRNADGRGGLLMAGVKVQADRGC